MAPERVRPWTRRSPSTASSQTGLQDTSSKPAAISTSRLLIAAGLADVGVTIRLGADAFGLHFIPYRDERYDLVIMETEVESAPIKAMLDALNSRRFAREVSQLCAYDTSQMGQVIRT